MKLLRRFVAVYWECMGEWGGTLVGGMTFVGLCLIAQQLVSQVRA